MMYREASINTFEKKKKKKMAPNIVLGSSLSIDNSDCNSVILFK